MSARERRAAPRLKALETTRAPVLMCLRDNACCGRRPLLDPLFALAQLTASGTTRQRPRLMDGATRLRVRSDGGGRTIKANAAFEPRKRSIAVRGLVDASTCRRSRGRRCSLGTRGTGSARRGPRRWRSRLAPHCRLQAQHFRDRPVAISPGRRDDACSALARCKALVVPRGSSTGAATRERCGARSTGSLLVCGGRLFARSRGRSRAR